MLCVSRARQAAVAAALMSALSLAPAVAVAAPASAPAAAASTAPASMPASAAAPDSLPLAAAAPAAAAEPAGNPYGLGALWHHGDIVARATLIILVIMSMGSWFIMIVKFFEQAKMYRQANQANKTFWSAGSVEQGAQGLSENSPFRFLAGSGLEALQKHDGLLKNVDFHTWLSMSIQRAQEGIQNRLQDGLAFLATVGSTAPFVGLFGTVWGIYHALTAIGIAGQASIGKVAGPVGEALIMTAIGLATAVPAVLGYNLLVRRNKKAMEYVRAFSSDLHSVLMGAQSTKA